MKMPKRSGEFMAVSPPKLDRSVKATHLKGPCYRCCDERSGHVTDVPPAPPPPPPGYGYPPPSGYDAPPTSNVAVGPALSWAWTKFQQNAGPLILVVLIVFVGLVVAGAVSIAIRDAGGNGLFGVLLS